MTIRTVGHGTLPADDFAELLRAAGVEEVVDVRSYPASRHNPQYGQQAMQSWLTEAGCLRYDWLRDLGGRRKPQPGSRHVALRNDAFRAYADHMETEPFAAAIEQLLDHHEEGTTTVMCSETVWWRCHRRLLADHLVLVISGSYANQPKCP